MKKHISYLTLTRDLLSWIIRKLKEEYAASQESEELARELSDLVASPDWALMLEAGDGRGEAEDFSSGGLVINPKTRRVLRDGEEISLTPKEFDILYFLFRNKGEVFTKEQIYHAVWEDEYLMADSNIMAFIRKLRKKIEPNPDTPEYILTIWGVGYKYNDRI